MPYVSKLEYLRKQARTDYEAYIQSEDWAAKRRVFWSSHARECSRCRSTTDLHVHHMSYDNFKNEPMSDLIGLCQTCHSLVHEYHRQRGGDLRSATLEMVGTPSPAKAKAKFQKPRRNSDRAPRVRLAKKEVSDKVAAKRAEKDAAYNAILNKSK